MSITLEVKRVFEEVAESYGYLRRRLWAPVGAVFRGPGVYLDCGCGPGQYSLYIAERFGVWVICLDIASRMLELAWKRAMRRGVDSLVDFVEADMSMLPFRDNVFHGAFYVASIHHKPWWIGRLRVLRESWRVLKSGSRLLVTVWSLLQPRFLRVVFEWIAYRLRGIRIELGDTLVPWHRRDKVLLRYYHLFTLSELRRIVRLAGFKWSICGPLRVRAKVFPENYYCLAVKNTVSNSTL